ncbi:MAG: UvrD-helicase domain-containing protein, partial [Candidatus Poseidoniales archaeon]
MTQFNNSQRLGLDIDKHIALDAGAGTGKTTVMAQRYIQHLLSPIQRATIATLPGPREALRAADSLKSSKQS